LKGVVLKEVEKVLQLIINNLPGNIYWKNTKGEHLGCNLNNAIAAGLNSPEEIIGKTDYELSWKDRADKIVASDKYVLKYQKKIVVEESIILPGQNYETHFLSQKMPFYEDGVLSGTIGISLDITELRKTQNKLETALKIAQEANNDRDNTLQLYKQFVEDQEHDIRTPLGNVVSCSEFLLQELSDSKLLSEEKRLLLEGVSQSSREILEYQESLLFDLYQGQLSEETIFTRFDLPEIVKHAYHVNTVSARYKNIDYTYSIDTKIPHYLLGDGKRIYQCLVDLLSNAVRFTHKGGVQLVVDCLKHDDKTAIVRFTIKDTGIGIPQEKQTDVLKAFVKAKPSNKGGERGRGLGLTRVNQYALEMGGELRFESIERKGSCFILVVPLKISLDQTETN